MIENGKYIIGNVYITKKYDQFKQLDGNREVLRARAKKIEDSIRLNGYIHNPIIVNEKMEVVDGQGRLEALRKLDLPVEYIVFDGLNVKDCIALNVYQTVWSLMDYIESYAERGVKSYSFLLALIKKYSFFGVNTCICACTGVIADNKYTNVKTGGFECTGEQYQKADELLGYVMRFAKTIQAFPKGPKNFIAHALMFAYQIEDVDKEKLVSKFEQYYGMDDVSKFIDARGALQALTNVYNRRNKDKVYFEVEYERSMTKKYTWYAKRHGKMNAI